MYIIFFFAKSSHKKNQTEEKLYGIASDGSDLPRVATLQYDISEMREEKL